MNSGGAAEQLRLLRRRKMSPDSGKAEDVGPQAGGNDTPLFKKRDNAAWRFQFSGVAAVRAMKLGVFDSDRTEAKSGPTDPSVGASSVWPAFPRASGPHPNTGGRSAGSPPLSSHAPSRCQRLDVRSAVFGFAVSLHHSAAALLRGHTATRKAGASSSRNLQLN